MNILLFFFALLTLLQHHAHGATMHRDTCINTFNQLRRQIAHRDQIANMIMVEYEMDLERVIAWNAGPDRTYAHMYKCVNRTTTYRPTNAIVVIRPTNWETTVGGDPGTTQAACIKMYCKTENIDVIGIGYTASQVQPIHGRPGSVCPENYVENNGLCGRKPTFFEQFKAAVVIFFPLG